MGQTPINMSDTVFIEDLKVPIRIGCEAEERNIPQTISVDVSIEVDTSKASKSKDLKDTVCYKTVCEMIQSLAAEREYVLLEEFGDVVSNAVLNKYNNLATSITLKIRKFVISNSKSVGIILSKKA